MSKVSTLGIAALSIASLCGCAAAAPQGTGMEATTGKTFGQWIDVYVAEQKAAYERHPDLPDIEKGAAMFLTTLGNRPDTTFNRDACTETGRRYYDAYKRFRESAKCERMLRQWQEAGGLSPEERDYRWLIYAIQAEDAHFSPSKPAGRAVAKLVARIYSNGRFTREEMDSIRHMLTRMAKVKGWTCGNLLIRPRGAGGWGSVMDVKKHYPFVSGIPAGRKAPNLSFTRYNANANLEKVDFHFSLDAFLTPQALLAIRDYVEKTTSPTPPPGGDFQLWAELKKGKPIFIFTEATQNTFDTSSTCFPRNASTTCSRTTWRSTTIPSTCDGTMISARTARCTSLRYGATIR